jgi:hypothetical protein
MKCNEAGSLIRSAPDTEISGNRSLISHIKTCKTCSKKYGAILKISMATAMKEQLRLPADFTDRVWDKIGEPNPSASFINSLLRPKWVFAAAVSACAILLVAAALNRTAVKPAGKELAANPAVRTEKIKHDINNEMQTAQSIAPADENTAVKQAPPGQINVAEKIAVNSVLHKDAAAPAPERGDAAFNGNPGQGIALARVPAQAPAGNVAAAGAANTPDNRTVQEELAAALIKGDEIKGDVAVYGNIFHPLKGEVVTFKYRVKAAGNVLIIAYDRKGKNIKRVYSGPRDAGIFTQTWDGKDENGITAANGIYIIYIKAGNIENKIKVGIVK